MLNRTKRNITRVHELTLNEMTGRRKVEGATRSRKIFDVTERYGHTKVSSWVETGDHTKVLPCGGNYSNCALYGFALIKDDEGNDYDRGYFTCVKCTAENEARSAARAKDRDRKDKHNLKIKNGITTLRKQFKHLDIRKRRGKNGFYFNGSREGYQGTQDLLNEMTAVLEGLSLRCTALMNGSSQKFGRKLTNVRFEHPCGKDWNLINRKESL